MDRRPLGTPGLGRLLRMRANGPSARCESDTFARVAMAGRSVRACDLRCLPGPRGVGRGFLSRLRPGLLREPLAADHGVEVTSAADDRHRRRRHLPARIAVHASARAIEVANADAEPGRFTITFSPESVFRRIPGLHRRFGHGTPRTSLAPRWPSMASGAASTSPAPLASLSAVVNGLTVTGANFALHGVRIHGFNGSCVAVLAERATIGGAHGQGNLLGGCKTGIAVSGADAVIHGNLIGLHSGWCFRPGRDGIVIAAGDVLVGGPPTLRKPRTGLGSRHGDIRWLGLQPDVHRCAHRTEHSRSAGRPASLPPSAPVSSLRSLRVALRWFRTQSITPRRNRRGRRPTQAVSTAPGIGSPPTLSKPSPAWLSTSGMMASATRTTTETRTPARTLR